MITKAQTDKYLARGFDGIVATRRRLWRILIDDLPPAVHAGVVIDSWTMTASFHIDIKALLSETAGRHNGVWNTGKYRLTPQAEFFRALDVFEPFVRVTGLQIQNAFTDYTAVFVTLAIASDVRFDACIVLFATIISVRV